VLIARSGVPVVVLVTDAFAEQAAFVARAAGMPAIPTLTLPHPVAGSPGPVLDALAAAIAPRVRALLEGERS
jgi:hypothetical protein